MTVTVGFLKRLASVVACKADDDDKRYGGGGTDDEEKQLQQVKVKGRPEVERLPSFTEVDVDGNGEIEFDEFRKYFNNMSEEEARRIFMETDINQDGKLDRDEYLTFRMRAYDFARAVCLPKSQRTGHRKLQYREQYSCCPPPVVIFVITLVEIGFFIYHTRRLLPKYGVIERFHPAPLDSVLIYSPLKRHEFWRFLTYFLCHSGYMHIVNNVIVQLALGILLEMVHKWWRVLIIYFSGVLAGSLATSIAEPYNYLAGASGGVYALIAAHLSTVILNWSEMEYPWTRILMFLAFILHDGGTAIYVNYVVGESTNVGYAAHAGGITAGLLTGIYILKNLEVEPWESVLWYMSAVILVFLTLFAVSWNIFKPEHYPPPKYD